jgi:hypothetical protein
MVEALARRAAASVVGHLDEHIAGLAAHGDGGGAGGRVVGDVRERLRDDEVGGRLDLRGEARHVDGGVDR